ncbi:MAG: hypothetical protein JO362_20230 [Streptomycetaceae bacterium]|nr:hypothetical protein [Streptomycetaceae bacterium]
MRRNSRQQPSEAFAAEEQHRADGLARRIVEISARPAGAPETSALPHYQAAYQDASGNAAAHTAQPEKPKRKWGRK